MRFSKGEPVKSKSLMPEWDGVEGIIDSYVTSSIVKVRFNNGKIATWPESGLESLAPQAHGIPSIEFEVTIPPAFETINQALKFDYEMKKPKYRGIAAERIKEGLCPHCGEKGRYHLSTPICSKHGAY